MLSVNYFLYSQCLSTRILIFDNKCKGSLTSIEELQESLRLLLEDIPMYETTAKVCG